MSDHDTLGRLARLPLRFLPKSAVVPVLSGPARGTKWIVGSATHGAWLGTRERSKQAEFARSVNAGNIVFDLGAGVGFYTLMAAKLVGPYGHVFAYEPLARNAAFLRRHVALNQLVNVEVFEAAPPELDATVMHGRLPAPHVIKLDLESGELQALLGMRAVLAKHKPKLFLATRSDALGSECAALLTSLGYLVKSL